MRVQVAEVDGDHLLAVHEEAAVGAVLDPDVGGAPGREEGGRGAHRVVRHLARDDVEHGGVRAPVAEGLDVRLDSGCPVRAEGEQVRGVTAPGDEIGEAGSAVVRHDRRPGAGHQAQPCVGGTPCQVGGRGLELDTGSYGDDRLAVVEQRRDERREEELVEGLRVERDRGPVEITRGELEVTEGPHLLVVDRPVAGARREDDDGAVVRHVAQGGADRRTRRGRRPVRRHHSDAHGLPGERSAHPAAGSDRWTLLIGPHRLASARHRRAGAVRPGTRAHGALRGGDGSEGRERAPLA
ncbi:hypothetical protein [Cellulomonas sp. ATA003]|uniref:hypothetical protein n=1 Tax=Cellulomonas sp. ATA003 TaxID=3073064 RepID=UPI0028736E8E|nr:hypothetical protein [Cellulomonas sp. ATA003]WNB86322.1 hypothetical protein REH70_03455 [Cellulomonas sp. ATA003]